MQRATTKCNGCGQAIEMYMDTILSTSDSKFPPETVWAGTLVFHDGECRDDFLRRNPYVSRSGYTAIELWDE